MLSGSKIYRFRPFDVEEWLLCSSEWECERVQRWRVRGVRLRETKFHTTAVYKSHAYRHRRHNELLSGLFKANWKSFEKLELLKSLDLVRHKDEVAVSFCEVQSREMLQKFCVVKDEFRESYRPVHFVDLLQCSRLTRRGHPGELRDHGLNEVE